MSSLEEGSGGFDIVIPIMISSIVLPSFLSIYNIKKYMVACEIEDLLIKWNIDINSIDNITTETEININWVNDSFVKTVNKIYPKKGLSIINEINNRIVKAEQEEKKRAEEIQRLQKLEIEKREKSQKEAEEKRLEELRLKAQIENDKLKAEERKLESKRIQEQMEKEKRKAEESRVEAIRLQEQIEFERKESAQKLEETEKQHRIDVENIEALANKKIEELENEIEILKKENANATFDKESKICCNCGKELIEGKRFCAFCGTKN